MAQKVKFAGPNYTLVNTQQETTIFQLADVNTEQELQHLQQAKSLQMIPSYGFHSMMKAKTRFDTIEYYARNCFHNEMPTKSTVLASWTNLADQIVVDDLVKVKFVALGFYFTVLVTDTQTVIKAPDIDSVIDHPLLRSNKVIDVQSSFYETYFLFDNHQCLKLGREAKFVDLILEDIHSIHPGGYFALFIKRDGFIYGHGSGTSGEYATPVSSSDLLVRSTFADANVEKALIPATSNVKSISSNWYQTLVLTHSNRLFMCGASIGVTFIELIVPDLKKITKICCYFSTFMALTDDHKVYIGQKSLQPAVFDELILQQCKGLVPIDICESYSEGQVLFGHPISTRDLQEQNKRILQAQEKGSFADLFIRVFN